MTRHLRVGCASDRPSPQIRRGLGPRTRRSGRLCPIGCDPGLQGGIGG
jgi:hypothetical protein